ATGRGYNFYIVNNSDNPIFVSLSQDGRQVCSKELGTGWTSDTVNCKTESYDGRAHTYRLDIVYRDGSSTYRQGTSASREIGFTVTNFDVKFTG
ncbi:MAG TPA: hypothetical protein VFH47_05070, partial [Candidatus Thermoplasmatota archaeon]|nr:hypothetical protein [Candidatus Thermoplasmatota archaeon]